MQLVAEKTRFSALFHRLNKERQQLVVDRFKHIWVARIARADGLATNRAQTNSLRYTQTDRGRRPPPRPAPLPLSQFSHGELTMSHPKPLASPDGCSNLAKPSRHRNKTFANLSPCNLCRMGFFDKTSVFQIKTAVLRQRETDRRNH